MLLKNVWSVVDEVEEFACWGTCLLRISLFGILFFENWYAEDLADDVVEDLTENAVEYSSWNAVDNSDTVSIRRLYDYEDALQMLWH